MNCIPGFVFFQTSSSGSMQTNRHLRYTCLAVFQGGVWGILYVLFFSPEFNFMSKYNQKFIVKVGQSFIHIINTEQIIHNKWHNSENAPLATHKVLMGVLSVLNNSRICEFFLWNASFLCWNRNAGFGNEIWVFYLLSLILLPSRSSFKSGPIGTGQIWRGKERLVLLCRNISVTAP